MHTLRCLAWVSLFLVVAAGTRKCPHRTPSGRNPEPVEQPPDQPTEPAGPGLDASDHPIAPIGSRLTLLGSGLGDVQEITIGGAPQPAFVSVDDETLTVEAIAEETPLGVQDIVVISPEGASSPLEIEIVQVELFPPILAPEVSASLRITGGIVSALEWSAMLGEIPLAVTPTAPGGEDYELAPIPGDVPPGRPELQLKRDGVSLAPLTITMAPMLINELDVCQVSSDDAEFIEIFVGEPNITLDGYVLVFFNGSNDLSYRAIDLSGENVGPSNEGGFLLIGSARVVSAPAAGAPGSGRVLPNSVIQNGPDAVALMQGTSTDFPNGTSVTAGRVIDALVYGTGDPDDLELLGALLGDGAEAVQVDESARGDAPGDSMARSAATRRDGRAFAPGAPTPGTHNNLR